MDQQILRRHDVGVVCLHLDCLAPQSAAVSELRIVCLCVVDPCLERLEGGVVHRKGSTADQLRSELECRSLQLRVKGCGVRVAASRSGLNHNGEDHEQDNEDHNGCRN